MEYVYVCEDEEKPGSHLGAVEPDVGLDHLFLVACRGSGLLFAGAWCWAAVFRDGPRALLLESDWKEE